MILETLAKATLILLLVALCATVSGRFASAAARHLVRVLGLASVLLLPLLVLTVPSWDLEVFDPAAHVVTSSRLMEPLPGLDEPYRPGPWPALSRQGRADERLPQTDPGADPGEGNCDCATTPLAAPSADGSREMLLASAFADSPGSGGPGLLSLVAFAWILGTLAVLARLGVGWLRMTRLAIDARPLDCGRAWQHVIECGRRLGLGSPPRVLTSSRIRVPVLWGLLSPTLLLPDDAPTWSARRLRAVLLHELGHLRRVDGLSLLLGRLATAVWWFHPLVWMTQRGARRDCERACDDLVLACGERPSDYAAQLVSIAGELPARSTPAGALAVVGSNELESRVRSILHPRLHRGLGRRRAVALLAAVTFVLLSVASIRLVARDERPERTTPLATESAASEPRPASDRRSAAGETLLAHRGHHDDAGEGAFERAYELHREERFDEAIEAFEEAIEAGYRVATSSYNIACGHARQGRVSEAVEWIERAAKAGFDDADLLREDSDLDPIRRDPAFRELLERLDLGGRGGDRYEALVDRYEDLRDSGSTEGHAWFQVGSALLRFRDFERSTDALERAAGQLAEDNSTALYNLACAHSLAGNTRGALDALERAVLAGFDSDERFRNDTDLDTVRGERRFDEIEALHDQLSLDRFRGGWNWGSQYSARRWEPAVDEFTAFTRSRSDVGRGWHNLGWALHFSRKHAEAREAFQRQLELGYRESNALYNIACTHAMEDQTGPALDWLERAVETKRVSPHQMLNDEDLESLYDDPRFEQLIERAVDLTEDPSERFRVRRRSSRLEEY